MECDHGEYMQWMKNPVICSCKVLGGERFVAESRRMCDNFSERLPGKQVTIKHFDHY